MKKIQVVIVNVFIIFIIGFFMILSPLQYILGFNGSNRGFYKEISIIDVVFESEVNFEIKIPLISFVNGTVESLQTLTLLKTTPENSNITISSSNNYLLLNGRSKSFQLVSTIHQTQPTRISGELILFSLEIFSNTTSGHQVIIDYYIGVDQTVSGYISFFFGASSDHCGLNSEKYEAKDPLNELWVDFGLYLMSENFNGTSDWYHSEPEIFIDEMVDDQYQLFPIGCS